MGKLRSNLHPKRFPLQHPEEFDPGDRVRAVLLVPESGLGQRDSAEFVRGWRPHRKVQQLSHSGRSVLDAERSFTYLAIPFVCVHICFLWHNRPQMIQ
jgi:hypothetical protein